MRNCARAGGAFGCVSGTSNRPLLTVSLRPPPRSTVPRPTVTTTLRPLMLVLRSASVIGGMPATGRITALRTVTSTDSPSCGMGGPSSFRFSIGELVAISIRSMSPLCRFSTTQLRTLVATKTGQTFFAIGADIGVIARPAASRGSPEKSTLPFRKPAMLAPRDVALHQFDAPARRDRDWRAA